DPEIIFFDEPQAGLDPVTTRELDLLFIRLNERMGITFFTVTHELLSIRRSAQKVLMLADGGVAFLGSLDEAMATDEFRVRRFFDVGSEKSV
ncbi:MAG TPA: ABC transporter ATP-binding protein, partial [bacterium]|nr:ABC transporter ATP-binding protein [bacterium]